MDAMERIDQTIEDLADRIYDINSSLKKMREFANVLYDRKLDMIVKGASTAEINESIAKEWSMFIKTTGGQYGEGEGVPLSSHTNNLIGRGGI